MQIIHSLQQTVHSLSIPYVLSTGVLTLAGFYVGKSMKFVRLPSVIGFMLVGVIMGPSVIGLLDEAAQVHLSFVTEICLGFVALSIGLELHLKSLKRQGIGIILIILSESFLAFILVTVGLYFLTGNFPLSLLFGAIAPASAPAGTVAIIQEYKAKGSLTQALYAVVGFDDGLGIIIFGFAAAFAKNMLLKVNGEAQSGFFDLIASPLKEIGLSILFGFIIAYAFRLLIRKTTSSRDTFIMTFAIVLVTTGVSLYLHLSLILTNMVVGLILVNSLKPSKIQRIRERVSDFMPLLFILFFILAGANLQASALPSLGLIGIVYIVLRSGGLVFGAGLGAALAKSEKKIRKYLGMGILSQAGVAIGLSLIVKNEFSALGPEGAWIGNTIITIITATSIFFGIIGPIFTKIGLQKAGEIPKAPSS